MNSGSTPCILANCYATYLRCNARYYSPDYDWQRNASPSNDRWILRSICLDSGLPWKHKSEL